MMMTANIHGPPTAIPPTQDHCDVGPGYDPHLTGEDTEAESSQVTFTRHKLASSCSGTQRQVLWPQSPRYQVYCGTLMH